VGVPARSPSTPRIYAWNDRPRSWWCLPNLTLAVNPADVPWRNDVMFVRPALVADVLVTTVSRSSVI
jgi:hypothetical protein